MTPLRAWQALKNMHFEEPGLEYEKILRPMLMKWSHNRRMEQLNGRLLAARKAAGYTTAALAAEAMGVPYSTYAAHENGSRGVRRELLARYASRFKITTDWLLTGKGDGPMQSDSGYPNTTLVSDRGPQSELDLELFDQATHTADMIIENFGKKISLEKRHRLIQQQYRSLQNLRSKNLVMDKD